MNLVSKYCLFSRLFTFAIFNEKKENKAVWLVIVRSLSRPPRYSAFSSPIDQRWSLDKRNLAFLRFIIAVTRAAKWFFGNKLKIAERSYCSW